MHHRWVLWLVLVVPWSWFLVRDRHPVLDTIAIGLPVLVASAVVVSLFAAAVRRRWLPVAVALSWAAFGLVTVIGPWVPERTPAPADGVRVVAANTYGNNSFDDSVESAILDQGPQVVVVSEADRALRDRLAARFANVIDAESRSRRGVPPVSVFSDLPMTDLGLPAGLDGRRAVRARIESLAGPIVVYGMHLDRPRFGPSVGPQVSVRAHRAFVASIRDAAAAEELPVVVAGDLNLVDRTSGYRRLTGYFDDAMLAGWGRPTAFRPLGLPFLPRIDHIFMPDGWCSARPAVFRLPGSDHRGVGATVGPCAPTSDG